MVVINDFMRYVQGIGLWTIYLKYTWGFSVLSGAIVLSIMILPTINIAEDAIRAVLVIWKEL